MDITREIMKLRKFIKPLLEDEPNDGMVEWLTIGFEYEPKEKMWHVVPAYEGAGDGCLNYIDWVNSERGTSVLQGVGADIDLAIKELWTQVRKYKKYRYAV